jgi:hypothetical protein
LKAAEGFTQEGLRDEYCTQPTLSIFLDVSFPLPQPVAIMRSLLSPSRLVIIAISLSLFTFIWTFVLPRELPQPVNPVVDHARPQAQKPEKPEKQGASFSHTRAPVAIATKALNPVEATNANKPGTTVGEAAIQTAESILPHTSSTIASTIPEKSIIKVGGSFQGEETRSSAIHLPSSHIMAVAPPYPTGLNATNGRNGTRSEVPCNLVPGASDIMVIVRTSRAEMDSTLPVQLDNLLACVPNFAIFSDHSGTIGNITIHDALEGVTSAAKETYDELKSYMKSQTSGSNQGILPKELDKWKMLPMVYKAYKMRPETRFFVFIQTDTSLSWTNVLQWTKRLDYRIPYYAGAPLQVGTLEFAQKGPGFMLSQGALKQYAKSYEERYESEWEKRVNRECCGDIILASTMVDAHVEMYKVHPQFQAEDPNSIVWTKDRWCTPPIGWHNMLRNSINEMWNFERNWTKSFGWEKPILMGDVFKGLIESRLKNHADGWDNDSQGTKIVRPQLDDIEGKESREWFGLDEDIRQAVESWQACQEVCTLLDDCQQWKYSKQGECHLGKNFKLGWQVPKDTEEPWMSGWIVERIHNTTREWKCDEPNWLPNQ